MYSQIEQNALLREHTNHRLKYFYGYWDEEVIDFDKAYARLRGTLKSQVFKNHRDLRLLRLLVNGIYIAKGNSQSVA
jgi:hypothetical protein